MIDEETASAFAVTLQLLKSKSNMPLGLKLTIYDTILFEETNYFIALNVSDWRIIEIIETITFTFPENNDD